METKRSSSEFDQVIAEPVIPVINVVDVLSPWRELLLVLQPLRNRARAFHDQNKISFFELRRGSGRFDLIRPICSEEYRFSG